MTTYNAPTKEALFILNDVLNIAQYSHLPSYEQLSEDLIKAIVEESGRFCSEVIAPLNAVGDEQGCQFNGDGSVTTPEGFKEAYKQFHESGWGALSLPEEAGGQGLPALLNFVQEEFLSSSSTAFLMYAMGAQGVFDVLEVVGSDEQKTAYGPKLSTGEWSGTMALTEPHAGSDVGLIRTKAEPQDDGSYRVTGSKIFISLGEHDLTENIIHLVLAKTPGAPDSYKGISLFLVPKILLNDDGSLGEANSLSCSGIEHKMGLRANATCSMNYDAAKGWLVGEENKGLAAMFVLMNAKRLECSLQGLGAAEVSYQNSAEYALDRRQGRALTGPAEPKEIADRIIVHPDVRRMLMDAKTFIEPMRALAYWAGLLLDISRQGVTDEERKSADGLLAFLIPVLKGYGTEKGLQTTIDMQQIWGGHGYITENGMDQFVRDVRVSTMYEGTTGIQAMDLVKRKISMAGGAIVGSLFSMMETECTEAKANPKLAGLAEDVLTALDEMKQATACLQQRDIIERAAGAYYYLELSGITLMGMMWLRIAKASVDALESNSSDKDFFESKLTKANYYANACLPDAQSLRLKIEKGNPALMALDAELFIG